MTIFILRALWKITFLLVLPVSSFAQGFCLNAILSGPPICDNNGTPGDPSDDTWSFEITVQSPVAGAGVNWYTNDPLGGNGTYGVPAVLGPFPASLDQIYFYAIDQTSAICTSQTLLVSNPCGNNGCPMLATGLSFHCAPGIPGDPTDDNFTYQMSITNPTGSAGWNADDPLSTSGGYGANVGFGPYLNSTAPFTFTIYDNADANCNFTLSVVPYFCGNLCVIIDSGFSGIFCTDPGTPSDPTDDYWEFTLNPSGFDLGIYGYTVSVSNGSLDNDMGVFGTPSSFIWNNTSGSAGFSITISSNGAVGCVNTFPITLPPGGCPATCAIIPTVNTNSIVCNDNGTPSDPGDDTFTFNATITGSATGASWMADDPNSTVGVYNIPQLFGPYPISGGPLSFTITDIIDPNCMGTITAMPPATCSNVPPCNIQDPGLGNITCTDNGTPGFPDDDILEFELNPTGVGLGSSYTVTSSALTISPNNAFYGGPTTFQLPNAGGLPGASIAITITDDADPGCSITFNVTNSAPCITCSIDVVLDAYSCDDNGTPNNPADDSYTVLAIVNGTGATWSANDPYFTTGTHNTIFSFGPYLISNGILAFDVTDDSDPNCFTTVVLTPPPPCSVAPPCDITDAGLLNINCQDNGTPLDDTDDIITIELNPVGSNLGLNYTISPSTSGVTPTTGTYGNITAFSFDSGSAGNGDITLTIIDSQDPSCSLTITVTDPGSCSPQLPCSISALSNNIICDDNGTPSDPADDTFTFDITVTGTNTGSGWTDGTTTGNYGTPAGFGPYPISGGNINLNIQDQDDPNCTTSITINAPNSCSGTCSISANSSNIICNDNGTPSDPADDTFIFDITVTGTNTGSGWTDGTATGIYGTASNFGPYPISGGNINLNIQDQDDANCVTTITVNAPATCSNTCSISANSSNIICDDNGTPSNPADDTFTFDITVTGANTGSGWTDGTATGNYGTPTSFGPYPISGGNINLNIQDQDDANCVTTITVNAPATCSNTCSISANSSNIICDDNGTPSDPADDTFTFDITVSGTNTGSWWTDGTATGNYGTPTSFGPYPISGGNINLNIQDQDDANCTTTITVNAPNSCSGICSISANSTNIICDDNGTPADPADDTFTFDITVTGANTGSGWTDGTVTGNYGTSAGFGPYPISGGNINLNIQDQDDANCTTTITVNAPNSCSGTCSISANSTNIICDDNGTPSDPADDTFTFDITVTGTNTGSGWIDGTVTGIYGTATSFGPYPIAGGNINVNIQDQDDVNCTTTITVNAPNSCSGTCSISANSTNIICNDNGTPSDPADDTFTFDITVAGTNTGSGWTDGTTSGIYGTTTSLGPFPISSGIINLNIQDQDDPNCTTTITVNAPNSCSGTCSISANSTNIICDDNGTPSDPADDTFTFDIAVTGTNTGSGWTDGTVTGNYGTASNFGPYPIAGGNINLNIQDQDDPNCTTSITVNAPNSCSGTCSISANFANIICNDNGTPSDPADDTFTFDITVTGTNTGSGWTDGTATGNYGIATNFGPFPIASGNINLNIQDQDDPNCTTTITINAPNPCSGTCSISANSTNISCNDNGTPTDPADDTFTFDITVSGTITGSGWTDGTTSGIYGTATSFGPFPISGGNINLNIQDQDDPNCTTSITINAPNSCSGTCSISANSTNIICNDNGTPTDPLDDTFTFDITVSGANTGSGWTDGTATGNYGTVTNFGPYPIAGGDINLNILDQDNSSCTTSITVNAPIACSNLCTISASTSNVNCDENGTPADPSDDTFTFDITVTGTNAGSGWTDGTFVENYNTPINYGPFLISAGNINLSIEDQDNLNCTTSIIINPPNTCSSLCTISANSSNIICNDNGTPTDPSDDIFTFDITVTGMNTGSGWTDGTSTGNYSTSTSYGPFPIAGGNINLNIQDQDDPNCQTTINISPPGACSNCTQTVDAGAPIVINCLQSNYQLTGSSSAPGNYEWSGPNFLFQGSLTATISEPGTYYFTTTFPNNCQVVDSVEVGIDTIAPIAFGGEDATLNCINDSVYLVGNLAANQTGQWTNALNQIISNNNEVLITQSGSYFYEIQNTLNGCISTADEVMVDQDNSPPQAIILADPANTLDCSILSINLFVNPENNVIYSWTGLGDVIFGNQIQIAQAGTYGLIALDTISGCTAEDQIEIDDLEDYPFINITPPNTITCDFPQIVLDASASQSGIDIMYTWLDENLNPIPNATNNSLLVSTAGIYYLQLNDENNGCENIDSITVLADIDAPSIDAGEATDLFCNESLTVLEGSTNDDLSLINIDWSTATGNIILNGNGLNPTVDGSGYYYIEAEFINNGCSQLDSVFININTDVPEIAFLNIQDESCEFLENGQLIVDQIEGGTMPFNYTLNNINSNNSGVFNNLLPGNYALQIEDNNGCLLDTSFVVSPGINLELDLPVSINIMQNDGTLLEGITNVDTVDLTFVQWSPPELVSCENCLTTEVLATEDQNFLLTIIHENGCTAIANIRVLVAPDATVYIPNVFSPNGDGINDNFTIYANESIEEIASLILVDRWGEIVFRNENFMPNDNSSGWDGRYNGKKMNPGVFVYYAEVILSDGSTKPFSGDLTLIW